MKEALAPGETLVILSTDIASQRELSDRAYDLEKRKIRPVLETRVSRFDSKRAYQINLI